MWLHFLMMVYQADRAGASEKGGFFRQVASMINERLMAEFGAIRQRFGDCLLGFGWAFVKAFPMGRGTPLDAPVRSAIFARNVKVGGAVALFGANDQASIDAAPRRVSIFSHGHAGDSSGANNLSIGSRGSAARTPSDARAAKRLAASAACSAESLLIMPSLTAMIDNTSALTRAARISWLSKPKAASPKRRLTRLRASLSCIISQLSAMSRLCAEQSPGLVHDALHVIFPGFDCGGLQPHIKITEVGFGEPKQLLEQFARN